MRVRFDESRHRYIDEETGKEYPGTTWILRKAGLLPETPPPKEALERGTRVHLAIRYDLEGDLDESSVSAEDRPYLEAARKAVRQIGFKVLNVEVPVINPFLKYGTAIDVLAMWNDTLTVVNWKTGSTELPHYRIQSALEALCMSPAAKRLNIHLLEDGNYRLILHDDRSDFDVARAACVIAHWKAAQKGANTDE